MRPATRPKLFRPRSNDAPDDRQAARRKAMDLLARREHGARELVAKLLQKGFDEACAEDAVGRLADEGLQCDERYAESMVNARINQGKGPLHIRHGLKQSGVASGIVDAALAAASVDWLAQARDAREKRFGPDPAGDAREHARQMRFLLQRGFSSETARRALND